MGVCCFYFNSQYSSSKTRRILGIWEVNDGQDGFSAGLVKSPVCCFESCDLDTVSYREGKRRQLRLWRISTDINVDVRRVPDTEFRSCRIV
jgi:hypothetical protein